MKILVATEETQGRRPTDFCWADEGEIVTFGSQCPDEPVDGPCGCRRALRGVRTRKATTTFRVVERPELRWTDLARVVSESLVAGGWYPGPELARAEAAQHARRLAAVALEHEEGAVLERRDEAFVVRRAAPGQAAAGAATSVRGELRRAWRR